MRNTNKIASNAKTMFKNSLTNGYVDSTKAKKVLLEVAGIKSTNLVKILKKYKKFIEAALAKEEVSVESASPIVNQNQLEKEIATRTGARRIRFRVNPKIVVGAKITHGDWIWDESLEAKLERLAKV